MQNKKGTLILIFIFILFMPSVLSISVDSVLSLYQEYYGWIDLALYTLIFVGIIQELMNYRFKKGIFGQGDLGSGAKAVSIGLGLALSISLVTWEVKSGFYLFQIGPFILIIFLLLALLWILGWIKSKNKSMDLGLLKKALFYLMILALIIYFFFPSLIYDYLPWSWVHTLFGVLAIITFLILLLTLGKHGAEEPGAIKGDGLLTKGSDSWNKWRDRVQQKKERKQREAESKRIHNIEKEKLAQKELERKRLKEYAEYLKKGIKVYITTIPHIHHAAGISRRFLAPYARTGLKTFCVKAGYPLELYANVEGGSEDYQVTWTVKPNVPFNLFGGGRTAIIPTKELQEAKDEELINIGKNVKTGWIKFVGRKSYEQVGVYRWAVYVQDRKIPKNKATDEVTIIITRNPALERDQLKLLKEERSLKIISTRYRKKEYSNKGIYLLPLDKTVELICKKTGTFEKIRWVMDGKILDKGEYIIYMFSKNKFKKGEHLLKVEGYYKNIKKTDSRKIYLKDIYHGYTP